MSNLASGYRDAKSFWTTVKHLKGNKLTTNQHLIKDGIKLIADEEKEELHRE